MEVIRLYNFPFWKSNKTPCKPMIPTLIILLFKNSHFFFFRRSFSFLSFLYLTHHT